MQFNKKNSSLKTDLCDKSIQPFCISTKFLGKKVFRQTQSELLSTFAKKWHLRSQKIATPLHGSDKHFLPLPLQENLHASTLANDSNPPHTTVIKLTILWGLTLLIPMLENCHHFSLVIWFTDTCRHLRRSFCFRFFTENVAENDNHHYACVFDDNEVWFTIFYGHYIYNLFLNAGVLKTIKFTLKKKLLLYPTLAKKQYCCINEMIMKFRVKPYISLPRDYFKNW